MCSAASKSRCVWVSGQFSQKSRCVPRACSRPQQPNAGEFSDNVAMSTSSYRPWALYLVTFLTALLVATSAVYWMLGLAGVAGQRMQTAPVMVALPAPDAKDLARALGGELASQAKPAETTSNQYQLLGVVAGPVGKGYALLAVGGAPPKAYTVGSDVGEGQVLQSVSARGVKIGSSLQSAATVELSLPKPAGV